MRFVRKSYEYFPIHIDMILSTLNLSFYDFIFEFFFKMVSYKLIKYYLCLYTYNPSRFYLISLDIIVVG